MTSDGVTVAYDITEVIKTEKICAVLYGGVYELSNVYRLPDHTKVAVIVINCGVYPPAWGIAVNTSNDGYKMIAYCNAATPQKALMWYLGGK